MENASADIGNRVKEIIIEQLGVDASDVVDGASIIDDLGAGPSGILSG